jgi:hypothetical protein
VARQVPVKGSVKTNKTTGNKYPSSPHRRNTADKKLVEKPKTTRGRTSKEAAAAASQLAKEIKSAPVLQSGRIPVETGQMAIFSSHIVDEEELNDLVKNKAAMVIELGEEFVRIEGRFDTSYGGNELCEVTVNGKEGYEMLAGLNSPSKKLVMCDPSLILNDKLYDEACKASGSKKGASSFSDGAGVCFTTYGDGECEANVFGDRGRVMVRSEDDGDDLYDEIGFEDNELSVASFDEDYY